ncbi:hypothetical protein FXV77_08535 [Sphingobacterium phlebotomi]|uniref:Helix-turn-helix domain-containing protein n=1 Tax=Sphingobacterium phlebotomi TaxID=2605433 RepID=A0A5D4H654_9SPHI|nr:helix-turn-helix domain-containing protein [Sphingobacterium phlebotomi]TYR36541.1 hypothetical protein FXV77_08535 [Sphingobacterium phlebotomi]
MKETEPTAIRYAKTVQHSVVQAIINGDLLLEEAMERYNILSKKTIIRWLKRYQTEQPQDM